MASEPVSVWVTTDDGGNPMGSVAFNGKPRKLPTGKYIAKPGRSSQCVHIPRLMGISVPPGECIEYVMLTADQYREMRDELAKRDLPVMPREILQPHQQPAELSPVDRIKLIATLATHLFAIPKNSYSVRGCASLAREFLAAAREIESEEMKL